MAIQLNNLGYDGNEIRMIQVVAADTHQAWSLVIALAVDGMPNRETVRQAFGETINDAQSFLLPSTSTPFCHYSMLHGVL